MIIYKWCSVELYILTQTNLLRSQGKPLNCTYDANLYFPIYFAYLKATDFPSSKQVTQGRPTVN